MTQQLTQHLYRWFLLFTFLGSLIVPAYAVLNVKNQHNIQDRICGAVLDWPHSSAKVRKPLGDRTARTLSDEAQDRPKPTRLADEAIP